MHLQLTDTESKKDSLSLALQEILTNEKDPYKLNQKLLAEVKKSLSSDNEALQRLESIEKQVRFNRTVALTVVPLIKAPALALEAGIFTYPLLRQGAAGFFIPLGVAHGTATLFGLTIKLSNPKSWNRYDYASAFCETMTTTFINIAANILEDKSNPDYPLDKKIYIFTVPVILTCLNVFISTINKDEKLTALDKARLAAALLQAVGILIAIYYGAPGNSFGPGEIFMRAAAGLQPYLVSMIGSLGAIVGTGVLALSGLYPTVKSMFFTKPVATVNNNDSAQKLLEGQGSSESDGYGSVAEPDGTGQPIDRIEQPDDIERQLPSNTL